MEFRSTQTVIEDQLRLRAAGDLDTDLQRNYADNIVLLCKHGVFRGCDAVRQGDTFNRDEGICFPINVGDYARSS